MKPPEQIETLYRGRFLQLVRREGWEYVTRTGPSRAAFIAALTDQGCLVLTQEYRIPVGKVCIGFPAGLIGDTPGHEEESLEAAVHRELVEEAGFEATTVSLLNDGPSSPGQSDEVIALVLAQGLKKVAPGGGIEGERIVINEIPLAEVHEWLEDRVREGCLIDPKVYAGLYFIHRIRDLSSRSSGSA